MQARRDIGRPGAPPDFVVEACRTLVAQMSARDPLPSESDVDAEALTDADRAVATAAVAAARMESLLARGAASHKARRTAHRKLTHRIGQWHEKHAARMAGRSAANILRALVDTGRASGTSLAAAAARLRDDGGAFAPKEAAMALTAFERAGWLPEAAAVSAACDRLLSGGAGGVDAAFALHALAHFAPDVPEGAVARLAEAVAADAPKLPLTTLAAATWSLAVLRHSGGEPAQTIACALAKSIAAREDRGHSLLDSTQRQLFHAAILAAHDDVELPLPEDVLDDAATPWALSRSAVEDDATARRVRRLFQALDVVHELDFTTADGALHAAACVRPNEEDVRAPLALHGL